jgi:methionyl-tRNA formyltransferase
MATIGVAATAPFGADVLERLAERHEIAFCLTRPDRPRGRGRRVEPPPAKVAAAALGLPVLQPERLDASVSLPVETVVAVAYGVLVPRELLDRGRWLNVHPSLLPRWRGAAPVERAIMAGDGETGVSIIRLVEELDAGPIGAREAFPLGPEDDAGAVYRHAAEVAARLLDPLPECFTPQAQEGATYAEKITAADRLLDLSQPAAGLVRRVRALSPHIGARAELEGRPVTVWRARVGDDGGFEPLEVQPEGGRRMDYAAWLRGLR